MGRPRTRAVPEVGSIRPISMRMVVVLPEPFGPRKPKTLPRRDGQVEAVDGELSAAVALGERSGLDHGLLGVLPTSGLPARARRFPGGRVAHRAPSGRRARPLLPADVRVRRTCYCAASAAFTSASLSTAPT